MIRIKSALLSAALVGGGLALLVAFLFAAPAVGAGAWILLEVAGWWNRPQKDFAAFELDPFEAARLDAAQHAAADAIERLADLDLRHKAGEDLPGFEDDSEALAGRYRILKSRISSLQGMPPSRLKKWSFIRGALSAARISMVAVPVLLVAALAAFAVKSNPLAGDPLRILMVESYIWALIVFPLIFLRRRRTAETSLGDREAFYDRWRPDDDSMEFYLERAERIEKERQEKEQADETTGTGAGSETEAPPTAAVSREKRPWHIVLNVDPDAPIDKIKEAYRQRMKEYHPDRLAGLGSELVALAEIIVREINQAYEEAGRARAAV